MRIVIICTVAAGLCGCDARRESKVATSAGQTSTSESGGRRFPISADDATRSGDAGTVSPVDGEGLERFIGSQAGNVVIVDFWATWCPACREGFPAVVGLHEKYKASGLTVTSVAIDDADQLPAIVSFLREQAAPMPAFISSYGGSDGQAMDAFQIRSGTIPTLKLYDRSGKLRYTFGDGEPFEHEEVEVSLRQLLNE